MRAEIRARARPVSCTSATRARRSSTGCSRAATAARSSCGSRTPTSSARRASRKRRSCAICAGSASTGTRGPTSADRAARTGSRSGCISTSRTRRSCSPPATRTTASARSPSSTPTAQAALAAGRPAALRGHVPAALAPSRPRRASLPASGRRSASACRRTATSSFEDVVRGDVRFQTDVIGDPVIVRADGTPAYNFAVVVDDALMESDACDPRRGSHLEHAAAGAAVRGARIHAAGLRAPGARDGAGSQPAVEAPRRDVGGRVPREGLSARGARELSGADRLVARRRRRSCCRSTSWRAGSSLEDVGHERRRVRRRKAGVGEPALSEDGRSGCGSRSCRVPYFQAARRDDVAGSTRASSFWRRRCRWRRRRSIGSSRCRRGWRSLFDLRRRRRRSPIRAVRERDAGGRRARRGRGAGRGAGGRAAARSRAVSRDGERRSKARTGQKGKALFHPIRVALTGRPEGPSWISRSRRSIAAPSCRESPACRRSSAAASARRRFCGPCPDSCAIVMRAPRPRVRTDADLRHQPVSKRCAPGASPSCAWRARRARGSPSVVDAGRARRVCRAARRRPGARSRARAAPCTRASSPRCADAPRVSVEDLVTAADGARR